MAVKRKAFEQNQLTKPDAARKRHQRSPEPDHKSAFRHDLFEQSTVDGFRDSYSASGPYPHAVVPTLIETSLLRDVRSEIIEHIQFTLKETDIYKIHQSGDLANLSNLEPESLKHLPSLVRLRGALYSHEFRSWVSQVTGAGKLSGKKTDMAVNVYKSGSYLLCHDDVIGSRRVSYILYLTNPDDPWDASWGGGLRLYPTESKQNRVGEQIRVPLAEHVLNIPPSFGQLSFFAVLPGESYHDVEEVYHDLDPSEDERRIRMAISGWFHIPQEGEEGYENGQEEAQAQRSSLMQLKGTADEFDLPQIALRSFDQPRRVMASNAQDTETDPEGLDDREDSILTEQDLTFLLKYLRAQFLTPDMIEQISSSFEETSLLQLEQILCDDFANEIRGYLETVDKNDKSDWKIARPPHKHRFAYLQEEDGCVHEDTPVAKLLTDLIHSHAFKKWIALLVGLKPKSLLRQQALARRFRRGRDYALASAFQKDQPQLEFTINITPSTGWETESPELEADTRIEYGGEEVYMAGDDDDASIHSKSLPQVGKKIDPAVYRAADDDEDDGILFAEPPAWNTFSVVLRDKGTLRFVKYVSQAARGDRWDIKGEIELAEDFEVASDVDSISNDEFSGNDEDG